MKALIIDDSSTTNLLFASILDEYDIVSKSCINPNKSINLILENHPDFIILDLIMPVMDGEAVLKEMQRLHIKIPVIIISAMIMTKKAKEKLKQYGVVKILQKPVVQAQLIFELQNLGILKQHNE